MSRVRDFIEVQALPGFPAPPPSSMRLPKFIGCQADASALLRTRRVVLIGCGSIGARVADSLARLAVKTLWLVDPKIFKPESLLTHFIDSSEIGQPKASSLGRRCKCLSPETGVWVFDGSIQQLRMDAFTDADLIVLASDNLTCEVEAGQRASQMACPLVQGAVHGESLTVAVRFFANAAGTGPCPYCLFGEAEIEALRNEVTYSCEQQSGPVALLPGATLPTTSISSLCSLAADLVGLQILRHVLALGVPVADTILEHNGYTHRTTITPLRRNPLCPCDHQPWRLLTPPQPLTQCTAGELAAHAGADPDNGGAIAVDGFVWVEASRCQCADACRVGRFFPAEQSDLGQCPKCLAPRVLSPFFTHRIVSLRTLGAAIDQTLGHLGAGAACAVLVRNADGRSSLFRPASPAVPQPL